MEKILARPESPLQTILMTEKQFLFYLGGGGNCINFIASLCHYNYYQQDELMVFPPKGDSHSYAIKNGIHRSLTGSSQYDASNFKVVNIHPDDILNHFVNFVYTYITIDSVSDIKFTFLNHFIKAQYKDMKKKFPSVDDRKLFDHFIDINQMGNEVNNFATPPELSTVMVALKFSDIYQNKKKVITFIEDLTETKSSETLHTNYDRYLALQKQIIQPRAPWFYETEGKCYFT